MKAIMLFLSALCCLNAQDCKHIKPAEVTYVGIQTAETIQNDSLNCIIFTRQAEQFNCPVCGIQVHQAERKDTVIFWQKQSNEEWLRKAREDLLELERLKQEGLK